MKVYIIFKVFTILYEDNDITVFGVYSSLDSATNKYNELINTNDNYKIDYYIEEHIVNN